MHDFKIILKLAICYRAICNIELDRSNGSAGSPHSKKHQDADKEPDQDYDSTHQTITQLARNAGAAISSKHCADRHDDGWLPGNKACEDKTDNRDNIQAEREKNL
jgi:hypothetical protein